MFLKVDDTLALRMPHVRGLGLSVLKGSIALGAGAFGLLAAATDQLDVAHRAIAASMARDWEIVHGPNRGLLIHSSASAPSF
jgi:hypothetical protein